MQPLSRRSFVLRTAATALLPSALRAGVPAVRGAAAGAETHRRLDANWKHRRGPSTFATLDRDPGPWTSVTLPHCVNAMDACDPNTPYFRGEAWYRTHIAVSNPFSGGRTVLHFQGAGQTSTLWVGEREIGSHVGGYDEFVFDITDALPGNPPQAVPVTVLCDNASDPLRIPSDLGDFCLFGGLYRHVNLVYLPALALNRIHVQTVCGPEGTAQVTVRAALYNPAAQTASCRVTIELLDPHGESIHHSVRTLPAWDGMADLASQDVATPDRWSPETPHLYRCRVTLSSAAGEMHLEERFGVRHTEFLENGPFHLNGQRVLLRGTQRHQDHAGVAAGMSDDQVRQEMQLIREMGANFIRLGHYQQDRLVLDLCDELGIMVWEEVPWCRAGVGPAAFRKNVRDMLTHMIEQHINHPSVILWGLGNEDDWPGEQPSLDKVAIRGLLTEIRDLAHTLDGSRLTSYRRCDFARDIPDVYSPSIWAGWYRGNYREYQAALEQERARVKRFIHMEWGADSQAGRHSEDPEAILARVPTGIGTDERGLDFQKAGGDVRVARDGDWSETYACNLFDWHLKTQESLPWLTGSAQWIFKDFASPLRPDASVPNMNQKGVVERDLTLKESYFVFQSYWASKPMAHLYGHTWPIRWGRPGEQRLVKCYSNCEHAELFVNGVSAGAKKRDSQNFPAAGMRWDVAFAAGVNHLRVVAKRGSVTVIDEVTFTYQVEPWAKPAMLRLTEAARAGDIVTVEAALYDASGVLCLDARNVIRFAANSPARLIDNMGTTRASRVLELTNGRARISLHHPTRAGDTTVTVMSVALPPASLTLLTHGSSRAQIRTPHASVAQPRNTLQETSMTHLEPTPPSQ